MYSLNRAQILGNLTRDAEMRYTPNGQAVSHFGVATNRRWKNQDGSEAEAVEFHDVVLWAKPAEALTPFLKKGNPVYVEGRLQTRSWEGQDGVKRYKTEIVAENVILLGGRRQEAGTAPESPAAAPPHDITENPQTKESPAKSEEEIDIDEIPF